MARRLLVAACLLLVPVWLSASQVFAVPGPASRPDIIVLMVDDLGAIDERILERLPNIRSLFLNHGLRFTNAFSETPLCCPGRASFLTGQHTRNHGVVYNDARLLDPRHTIATALHDSGYFTMMVGKYLNGAAQLTDHTPPGWDEVAMLNDWSTDQSSDWWVQDEPVVGGFFDRFIDFQSREWLTTAPAAQPLFMWVAPHAPHKSAESSVDWEPDIESTYVGDERCAGIKPWQPPSYDFPARPDGYPLDDICRSLLTVDDIVGDLQATAAAAGRDPVWVFTSDNGMAWGANGYVLKNVPAADRLPFYVAGPGVVSGTTKALISNIDVAPTLVDLAKADMPTADGKSFTSVLRGDGGGRKALLEDHPVGGPTGEGDVLTGQWWGVRTPRWHLVVWNGIHLYDTDADRWEMVDVAADHPDVVNELLGIWNRPIPSPTAPATSPPPPTPLPTPIGPSAIPTSTSSQPPPTATIHAPPEKTLPATPTERPPRRPVATRSANSTPDPAATAAQSSPPRTPGGATFDGVDLGAPTAIAAIAALGVVSAGLALALFARRARPKRIG
jgi:arylsulfatase A-like enzyme